MVISIYAVSFTLIWSVLIGLVLAPVGSEKAAAWYITSSYVVTAASIIWIFKRSLNGSIFKPIVVLIFSSLVMSILLLFALLAAVD